MIKKIIIVGFLLCAVAFNSHAHNSDRSDQLETEIEQLNNRLSELESLLGNPNKVEKVVKSGEGWKLIKNWRKLTTGMSPGDVKTILGEPERITGGLTAFWDYPNGGRVAFFADALTQWQEP